MSSVTLVPECLCIRKVTCEGLPSLQCPDRNHCSPFHPASCEPSRDCFLLIFHYPTITRSSSLVPFTSPCTCSCCFLLHQSFLPAPSFLVALPCSPQPQVLTCVALQPHHPLLLGPAPLPSPQTHSAIISGKGLEHPPWFSLVLLLAWSPPSLPQVCKSLLPMSASKLVYPPPIPAFITLPK